MQFSLRQLLIAVTCFCIVIAMYAHGNELLGVRTGILFASLTAATLFVLWRVFSKQRSFQRWRQAAALAFASGVFTILAFPEWFSSDIADAVQWKRKQRIVEKHVHDVLQSDARFSRLDGQCTFLEGPSIDSPTTVAIAGQMKTERDLLELRERLLGRPHMQRSWLSWDVTIEGTRVRYRGGDLSGESRGGASAFFSVALLEHEIKAFAMLNDATSVVVKQLPHRGIINDRRVTVTDETEVRKVKSWLDFALVEPCQGDETQWPCLVFQFDDERTVQLYVGEGKWWCFPGGVRRQLDRKLWDYLERLKRE